MFCDFYFVLFSVVNNDLELNQSVIQFVRLKGQGPWMMSPMSLCNSNDAALKTVNSDGLGAVIITVDIINLELDGR